ncbi:hypothetical protein EV2_002596 [Malus domestica]
MIRSRSLHRFPSNIICLVGLVNGTAQTTGVALIANIAASVAFVDAGRSALNKITRISDFTAFNRLLHTAGTFTDFCVGETLLGGFLSLVFASTMETLFR